MLQKIKIILDTNWWISFIISKNSFGFPNFFFNERIVIISCKELKDEIKNTLAYARANKRINPVNLETYYNFIENAAKNISVISVIEICNDPDDNFRLALSKDANADFLITNDIDLLSLKKFENTSIVTLTQFIQLIK